MPAALQRTNLLAIADAITHAQSEKDDVSLTLRQTSSCDPTAGDNLFRLRHVRFYVQYIHSWATGHNQAVCVLMSAWLSALVACIVAGIWI